MGPGQARGASDHVFLFMIFLLHFGTDLTVWYFLFFVLVAQIIYRGHPHTGVSSNFYNV